MGASLVLTFYDFVGVIIPGSVLLLSLGLLFDLGKLADIAVPRDAGLVTAHLVLAYVIGHLIQALGNWLELLYWRAWKGRPTDWPLTREGSLFGVNVVSEVTRLYHKGEGKSAISTADPDLAEWRRSITYAVSLINAEKQQDRMQTFNSLYGMFRGMVTSFLLILILYMALTRQWNPAVLAVLLAAGVLSIYSMHKFSRLFAAELFAIVRRLLKTKPQAEPAAEKE